MVIDAGWIKTQKTGKGSFGNNLRKVKIEIKSRRNVLRIYWKSLSVKKRPELIWFFKMNHNLDARQLAKVIIASYQNFDH